MRHAASVLTRRSFLRQLGVGGCAVFLAGCQQAVAPAAPAPSLGDSAASRSRDHLDVWGQLLEAARPEGVVSVYAATSPGVREAVRGFESAAPSIKLDGAFLSPPDLLNRLSSERTASRYLADVLIGPAGGPNLPTMKAAGMLASLQPALALPEVTDPGGWFQNRLWWADSSEPYTTLSFQGYLSTMMSYNTRLVDPAEFRSLTSLLDPKWRGRIVAADIRRPFQGSVQIRFLYKHLDLGPQFLRRLFEEMDLTISVDHRQMADWLAQGRFAIGLFVSPTEILAGAQQGLPVGILAGDHFREGGAITVGGGTVNLADSAPHPNAAKLFINWLLSRDGQINWQNSARQPSLRIDIPREGLDPTIIPKAGVNYVDATTQEFGTTPIDDVIEIVNRVHGG